MFDKLRVVLLCAESWNGIRFGVMDSYMSRRKGVVGLICKCGFSTVDKRSDEEAIQAGTVGVGASSVVPRSVMVQFLWFQRVLMMKEQKRGPKQLLTVQGKMLLNPYRTEKRSVNRLVWCESPSGLCPGCVRVRGSTEPIREQNCIDVQQLSFIFISYFFFVQNKSFQLWCNLRSLRYNSSRCLPGLFPLHSLSWVTLVTFWMLVELGHLDLTRGGGRRRLLEATLRLLTESCACQDLKLWANRTCFQALSWAKGAQNLGSVDLCGCSSKKQFLRICVCSIIQPRVSSTL